MSDLHSVTHWKGKGIHQELTLPLQREEPLTIHIQGAPYTMVMRTPGDEISLAAGLCLGDGLLEHPEDLQAIDLERTEGVHVAAVTLSPSGEKRIPPPFSRCRRPLQTDGFPRSTEGRTDPTRHIPPLTDGPSLDISAVSDHLKALSRLQHVGKNTKAAHAAALYSREFELLSSAEDVGRHNALDKAVGKLFLEGGLHRAEVIILSSRLSWELVQKAARARISVVLTKSRPTTLAITLAEKLNMTVVCGSREAGVLVFCGKHRLRGCP